ncbi:MAG: 2-amino-4-oxopentanoate thiolase subunit OrtA [bacterium]|nr:2-amino-4-oxopentanoate thiolase subunit OrtA [bacterium]
MTKRAQVGDWVQIHRVVLPAGARAPQVPADTQSAPLEMWVKGILLAGGELGQPARIRTAAGRELEGRLVAVRPPPGHDFGEPVPQLAAIGAEVRAWLERGGEGS